MSELNDRVKENTQKLNIIETDLNNMKVDVGKLTVALEHESKAQTERYNSINTQSIELKDLMKERMRQDEEREREHREYREKREMAEREAQLNRQKWVQSVFTPQTVVIILAMILSLFGLKFADFSGAVVGDAAAPKNQVSENP